MSQVGEAPAHQAAQQVDEIEDDSLAVWWPVLGAGLLVGLIVLGSVAYRISRSYPRDVFESVIVAEAHRASVGLPVYTDPTVDHATQVYGPLVTYLNGAIFKIVGTNLYTPRALSLLATIWIIAALGVIYFKDIPMMFGFVGVTMLLALNIRSKAYFTQARPDMMAIGLALLALMFLFRGIEKRQWMFYALGIVLICTAYLFKQTAAMYSAVPVVVLLSRRREWSMRSWMTAVLPLLSVVMLIIAIRIFFPRVHDYMITVPGRWPTPMGRLLSAAVHFFGFTGILPLALCALIVLPGFSWIAQPRVRWLVCATIISIPAAVLTFAKKGGEANSYLPMLLPLITLCTIVLARAWSAMAASGRFTFARQCAFAWVLSFAMVFTAMGGPNDDVRNIFAGFFDDADSRGVGDDHYPQVVEYVSQLKGKVVCPNDPTIPMRALNQPCRSAWAEYNYIGLEVMPPYLLDEVKTADWAVLVETSMTLYLWEPILKDLGFKRTPWLRYEMGPNYSLWHREKR